MAPSVWYVSKATLLGANYGVMVVLPFANAALEAPAFTFGQTVDTSIADMLVRPLDLGWQVLAIGPDVALPIASKTKLFALVNIRNLWEAGAQLTTEGETLVVTSTFRCRA